MGYKIYEKDRLTTSRFVKAKNFIPSTIAKQESKELLSLFNRKVFDYEDILIEAYLRIFKYINSFNIKKDGYNWMCRIVQNVAYDFNSQTVSNLPLTELTFSSIIGDEIDKFIAKDELFSIICNLSAQEQNLIYLRFYEGLTYLEIAKMLNSRKSTVHKQINTILKKLRK